MLRPLKEIILPASGHKVYIVERPKFGEDLDVNSVLYDHMDFEKADNGNDNSDGTPNNDMKYKLKGAAMAKLIRKKMLTYVKSVVLGQDIEGIGKKDETVKMTDDLINDLETSDGALLQSEIEKMLEEQKKKVS